MLEAKNPYVSKQKPQAKQLKRGYRTPDEQQQQQAEAREARKAELKEAMQARRQAAMPAAPPPNPTAARTALATSTQALMTTLATQAAKQAKQAAHGSGVHLNDEGLARIFTKLDKKLPWLDYTSTVRSTERQRELWEAALKKYGDPEIADNWVARPGTSNHEKGIAVDVSREDIARLVQWLANHPRYGNRIHRPMDHEPWHFELRA